MRFTTALALVLTLLWLALPYFISADRFAAALRSDLRIRGGMDVQSPQPPAFSLWPAPSLTFAGITVQSGDGTVLFEAESLEASFSLFEALSGVPHLKDMRLVRPRLRLPRPAEGGPPRTGGEVLALAARLMPRTGAWPLDRRAFGTLEIVDGALVMEGAEPQVIVPDLDATLSWPDPDEPFTGSVSAEIDGKRVQGEIDTPQLPRLLAGGDAQLSARLALPGALMSFEGSASLTASGYFAGRFDFEAANLPALFSWYGLAPQGLEAMHRARATARLSTANRTLRFDQLAFSVNDTAATGIMDLSLRPGGPPKFTGTLAFEDFDLGDIDNLLPLAGPFAAPRDGQPLAAAFDIRLSARQVRIGEAVLGRVAASMLIGPDHALLDIGDSEFEGGRLTGRLNSGPKGLDRDMRLQLSVRDVDLARLGGRLGLADLWPAGPGFVDVSLSSDRPFLDTRRPDLSGKAVIAANGGRLQHFGASGLRALRERPTPFALSLAEDAFDYERLDARLRIEKGEVIVEAAAAENGTDRLQFDGRLSATDELDVTVRLTPLAGQAAPLTLTIGGPRNAPMVVSAGPGG